MIRAETSSPDEIAARLRVLADRVARGETTRYLLVIDEPEAPRIESLGACCCAAHAVQLVACAMEWGEHLLPDLGVLARGLRAAAAKSPPPPITRH